jgi:release factor glutamine methyltransferase
MTLTLVKAWTAARDRLKAAGVDGPVIDARLLVEAACEATRTDIITEPHREVTQAQQAVLEDYIQRREKREPVSHILGRKGFWKIMVDVNTDVLTPRPESDVIVDLALRAFEEAFHFRVLDLGVGSGAIVLAILAERPGAKGLGIDISEEALAVARDNAAHLGLSRRLALLRSDWTTGLSDGEFDLVVSNPPYIASHVIETLQPEVAVHEPRVALDGGPDGLDAYRVLAPEILRVLKPSGIFAVEIGHDQKGPVEALFKQAGALNVVTIRDLSDKDRVVTGIKNPLELSH